MVIIEDLRDSEEYLNKNKILRDSREILDMAIRMGASEAEVYMIKGKDISVSVEKDRISFIAAESYSGYGLRVINDGRLGFAYSTTMKNAKDIIKNAIHISKVGKKVNFDFPARYNGMDRIPDTFDSEMLDIEINEINELTERLIDGVKSVRRNITISGGGVGIGVDYIAIVNTSDLEVTDAISGISASAYCVLRDKSISTGYDYHVSPKLNFDPQDIGRKAGKLAVMGQNPGKLTHKVDNVVFVPDAIGSLVEHVIAPAFYGENVHKGSSIYSPDQIGENVASKGITLRDDPTLPGNANSGAFDDEGVPSKNNHLISSGKLKGFLYTLSSGAEYGHSSTGNAIRSENLSTGRSYKAMPITVARNLIIEGKSPVSVKKDLNSLVSEVDSGVLVYDVLGAHTANPGSGDFSVNSAMVFLIKKGEIAMPLESVMLSGNMPQAMNNIHGIGRDHKVISGGLSSVGMTLPSIWFSGITVTP